MRKKIPIYAEVKPHQPFMAYVREWLKERHVTPAHLLVSKPNLVIAVIHGVSGNSIICFYIRKLCSLGTGGVVVYYDTSALSTRLKESVENTFTNWLAVTHAL